MLQGLLGASFDDPRTMATLQLAQGLLGGGGTMQRLATGAQGYGATMQQAREAEERRKREALMQQQLMQQIEAGRLGLDQQREGQQRQRTDNDILRNLTMGAPATGMGPPSGRPSLDPMTFLGAGGSMEGLSPLMQINAALAPKPRRTASVAPGAALVDEDTGQPIFENPRAEKESEFAQILAGAGIAPGSPEAQQMYRRFMEQKVNPRPLATASVHMAGQRDHNWGDPPKDHVWARDPNTGQIITRVDPKSGAAAPLALPVAGSPTARGIEGEEAEARTGSELNMRAAQTVFEDSDRALAVLQRWGNVAAGPGSLLDRIPTTPAQQLRKHIDSIKGNVGIDSLLKIKASGAGLGAIPQAQLEMLASLMGNLDNAQTASDLQFNIARINEIYGDIVRTEGGDPVQMAEERRRRLSGPGGGPAAQGGKVIDWSALPGGR
jgi:hypothetical protein